jgi:hypothetical protein
MILFDPKNTKRCLTFPRGTFCLMRLAILDQSYFRFGLEREDHVATKGGLA